MTDERELLSALLRVASMSATMIGESITDTDQDWQPMLLVAGDDGQMTVVGIPGEALSSNRGKDMIVALFAPIAQEMHARAMCFVTSAFVKGVDIPKTEMVTVFAASPHEMALQLGKAVRTPDGATLEWQDPIFTDKDNEMQGRFPEALRAALRA